MKRFLTLSAFIALFSISVSCSAAPPMPLEMELYSTYTAVGIEIAYKDSLSPLK